MVDIEDKNKEAPVTPVLPAGAPAAAQPPISLEKTPIHAAAQAHEMSKGEAWFEDFFYWKVNYWLNLGMSLLATDFFTHEGEGGFFTHHGTGKRWLENGSQRLAKAVEALGIAKAGEALSSTRAGLKTLALNSGGWLLLIPLYIAEQNKRAIVHWKNKRLGVNQHGPDGHELTPEQIYIEKEQPDQNFLWVAGRRTLASGSTIVTGVLLDKVATTKDSKTGATIYGQDRVTGLVKDMVNNTVKLTRVPGNEHFVKSGFIQRYLGFAALDTLYTWMTATVMEKTNGAKHLQNGETKTRIFRETGKEIDLPAAETTATNPSPATVTPSLEKYKQSTILPPDKNYADKVSRANETDYSMAP